MKHSELIPLCIIWLITIYLWTLPINEMPFGDVDSSVHYTSGDYMAQKNMLVYSLPYYLNHTIGSDTKGRFAYPQQFNVNVGIAQIMGGGRIIPSYILIAVLSSLGVFGIYLLVRKLYGKLAGFCAGFLMIFSRRDIMYYLFGLWPQTIAFAFVPIIIYFFYSFIHSDNKNKRWLYIIITSILTGFQYTFHPQAFFFSIAFVIIYSFIIFFTMKKLPFKIKEVSFFFISIMLLAIILAPFQFSVTLGNLGITKDGGKASGDFGFKPQYISRLFYWFKEDPSYYAGLPPNYFKYTYIYGGYWTLPLLLFGALLIFIRRKKQDILLISWLITLYLFLHMELVGGGRNFRFLQLEAQIFSVLIVLGLFGVVSFFKISEERKSLIRYAFTMGFIILTVIFNAIPVYSELSNSYKGIMRITPPEYSATEWLTKNTPEDANFLLVGTFPYNKKKWLQGLSFRSFEYDNNLITQYYEGISTPDYVFIDYSDLSALGRYDIIQQIQLWEKSKLENASLIYNQNNIKVYELGNREWTWE